MTQTHKMVQLLIYEILLQRFCNAKRREGFFQEKLEGEELHIITFPIWGHFSSSTFC